MTEQHRQADTEFSSLLSAIRSNRFSKAEAGPLASRRLSQDSLPRSVTRLFTHNMDVDRINQAELVKLPGEPYSFHMTSTGDKVLSDSLEARLPLARAAGSQDRRRGDVHKNDSEGRFVNGTLGVVSDFGRDDGYPIVLTKSGITIATKPAEWKVTEDESPRPASSKCRCGSPGRSPCTRARGCRSTPP